MIYESTMSNRLTDAGVGRMSLWKTLQTVITRVVENGKLRAGLLFLFVFHAVGIVFVASRQGPGMSSDSVFYASAARAFAATGELVTYSGAPLAAWPPGFPLTLGWAIRLGLDLESFATALNLACVALVVLLTYQLAVVTLKSSGLALLSALLVSAAASTVRVFSMLWTEPVFAVLVLVTLVVLAHAAGEMETNWYWLLIVAVAVTVATLFRFAGFALIPVVALGVALAFRRRGWIRAVSIGFAAAVAASVGMLLVLYRNLLLGGSLLGTRAPNPHSARQILWASFADLSQYLLPVKTAWATEVGILIAVLLLFAVWRIVRARNLGLLVVAAFVVIYWPFLWYSAFSAGIDLPNERLTSPIHGPMVAMAVFAIRELWARLPLAQPPVTVKHHAARALVFLGVSVLGASVILSLMVGWKYALSAAQRGIGHNSIASLESPLARAIRDLPAVAGVAANDANQAYWATGRTPMLQTPRIGYVYEALGYESMEKFIDRTRDGSVTHLAFFDANIRGVSEPDELVAAGVKIELIADYSDGSLWQVTN